MNPDVLHSSNTRFVRNQMTYFKVIAFILLLYSCKMPAKETFRSEVNDLFFQVDVSGSYESSLKYYRTVDVLRETEPEGYTTYPPLSALGSDGRDSSFHSFQFDHHPYAPSPLSKDIRKPGKSVDVS